MVNLAAPEFNAPEACLLPMTPPSQLDATSRDFMAAILFVSAAICGLAIEMLRRLRLIAAPAQSADAAETSNR